MASLLAGVLVGAALQSWLRVDIVPVGVGPLASFVLHDICIPCKLCPRAGCLPISMSRGCVCNTVLCVGTLARSAILLKRSESEVRACQPVQLD